MPREADPSINEKAFVLQALAEGVRIDSRSLDAYRDIKIQFGREFGVADVQLGLTRIVARISCEVTQPFAERSFDGIFMINTELSPLASAGFEVGRQNDLETLLSRFLEKAIRRSNALDTESLCIVAGQKCWTVRADVHVLNHDGNLVDAACIAVVTALQHFRRPDVSVEGEEVKVFSISERVPVPLSLLHHPYCISVGFFHQGTVAIVDPTLLEQQISEGEMIVTANRHGEVCQIAKLGGVPTDALPLLESIHLAASKATEISKRVTSALDEDSNERNLGGLVSELTAENER